MFVPIVIFYLEGNDKILLLCRGNVRFGSGFYSLPGGKVEPNESALQAVVREAYEELGILVKQKDLSFIHCINRNGEHDEQIVALVFKVQHWQGEPFNKEPEKHSNMAWFPVDALPEKILPAHKQIIEMVSKGVLYSQH